MVKISNLPDGGDQQSGDVLPGVRGGTTQKVSGPLVQSDLAANGGTVPELNRDNDFGAHAIQFDSAGGYIEPRSSDDTDRDFLKLRDSAGNLVGTCKIRSLDGNGAGSLTFNLFDEVQIAGNRILDTTDLAANGGSVPEVDQDETITGTWTFTERSSDPADPAEGQWVQWMSDGTGTGDDGDIMAKITAGGVTKTVTLIDFSAV